MRRAMARMPRVIGRSRAGEADAYYFRYIDRVPGDDSLAVLQPQLEETVAFPLADLGEEIAPPIRRGEVDDAPGRQSRQRLRAPLRLSGVLVRARLRQRVTELRERYV